MIMAFVLNSFINFIFNKHFVLVTVMEDLESILVALGVT